MFILGNTFNRSSSSRSGQGFYGVGMLDMMRNKLFQYVLFSCLSIFRFTNRIVFSQRSDRRNRIKSKKQRELLSVMNIKLQMLFVERMKRVQLRERLLEGGSLVEQFSAETHQ